MVGLAKNRHHVHHLDIWSSSLTVPVRRLKSTYEHVVLLSLALILFFLRERLERLERGSQQHHTPSRCFFDTVAPEAITILTNHFFCGRHRPPTSMSGRQCRYTIGRKPQCSGLVQRRCRRVALLDERFASLLQASRPTSGLAQRKGGGSILLSWGGGGGAHSVAGRGREEFAATNVFKQCFWLLQWLDGKDWTADFEEISIGPVGDLKSDSQGCSAP